MLKALKIILPVLALGLVLAFYLLGGESFLALENVRAELQSLRPQLQQNVFFYTAWIVLCCVLMLSLPLPSAAVITLSLGFLYGFWVGLLLVSIVTVLAALITFIAARYIARDFMVKKFAQQAQYINQEIARAGFWYALSLRLIPGIPFFASNAGLGLTRFGVLPFYITTQLGMLPMSALFINSGNQLHSIQSITEVISIKVVGSFLLVAMMPLLIGLYKRSSQAKVNASA